MSILFRQTKKIQRGDREGKVIDHIHLCTSQDFSHEELYHYTIKETWQERG